MLTHLLAQDVPDTVPIYIGYQTQSKHVKDFVKILIKVTMNVNVYNIFFKRVHRYIFNTNRFK